MRFVFYPGRRYIGGAETPFFVTEDMVRDEAEDVGFREVLIWDADAFGAVPFAVKGDYDLVAMGVFEGPGPKAMDLPDEVKWVWDVTGKPAGEGLPTTPPGGPPVLTEPIGAGRPIPAQRRWWVIGLGMVLVGTAAGGAFALAERAS